MYSPLVDVVTVDGITYNKVDQNGMMVLVPQPAEAAVSETRWTIDLSERELALVKWLVANVEDGSFNLFTDKAFKTPYGATKEALKVADQLINRLEEVTGGNDLVAYRDFFQEWTRNV